MWRGLCTFFLSMLLKDKYALLSRNGICRDYALFWSRFYSDFTQINEIWLRLYSDIWAKKWRVRPLGRGGQPNADHCWRRGEGQRLYPSFFGSEIWVKSEPNLIYLSKIWVKTRPKKRVFATYPVSRQKCVFGLVTTTGYDPKLNFQYGRICLFAMQVLILLL